MFVVYWDSNNEEKTRFMGVEFTSNNQPKERKPRGKGKKSLMLDAIRSVCEDEKEFLQKVIVLGLGDGADLPANPALLSLVLNRIEPPLKATSPMVEFEFDGKSKPHEQAAQVLNAVASGKIAPDIGHMFVTSISSMLKIQEITDIDERLKAMEDKIEQD